MIVELVGENNIHKIRIDIYNEKVNKYTVGGEAHGVPYYITDVDVDYEIDAYLIHKDKEHLIDFNKIKEYDNEIEQICKDIEVKILNDFEEV